MLGALDDGLVARALEDHDEGFCVFDRSYGFLWCNRAAAALLQRDAADLIGRRLFDEFPEARDTIVWSSYEEAFERQRATEIRLWYGPLAGWFRARAVPFDDRLVVWFRNVDAEQSVAAEREQLLVRTARSDERAERLLDVVAELSRATTLAEVIDVVLERGFGLLGAHGGGVGFVSDDGEHLEVVDLRNFGGDIGERWTSRFPLDADVPMMNSARTGEPLFYGTLEELHARYPHLVGDFGERERTRAFASLPLRVDDRVTGGLVVMFDQPQDFRTDEQEFMLTLAGLSAQALERARLTGREREIAITLQESLLPRVSPLPGLDVAVRYVPGAAGTEVGGDFYDIVPLGAGRAAITIGDVMGRGVGAAALMGQVRAAVRAYAQLDLPAEQVIGALDTVVGGIAAGAFVTCAYALFDPADRTLTVCSAGHLPPVVVSDGRAELATVPVGAPLGVGVGGHLEQVLELPPGAVVALCTDGLVESRHQDVDTGLGRLAGLLVGAETAPLEETADATLAALLADSSADDAALVLLRTDVGGAQPAGWQVLRRHPEVVRDARQLVHQLDLSPSLTDTVLVVVSELVTNAIRHGRGDPLVRLRVAHRRVVVEVEDSSGHLPRRRFAEADDEGGRGLELVAALSARWGWRPTAAGKVVWAEVAPDDAE